MASKSISSNSNSIKICSIEGCNKGGKIRKGWCSRHYERNRNYGSPHIVFVVTGLGQTFEERFWSRVKKNANDKGCWEWQGKPNDKGYGAIVRDTKVCLAHRISWELTYDTPPNPNLILRHYICDNPICVNPEHLREGTHQDNANDRVSHGRQQRGIQFSHAKVDDDKVRKIRNLLSQGLTNIEISKMFGVGATLISDIKNGKRWTHVK